MKKNLKLAIIVTSVMAVLASCNKNEPSPIPSDLEGVYVVNSGSWGQNNACITIYNPTTKAVKANSFKTANGLSLGDTAEDMISCNGYKFIAVSESKVIFVTDKDLKVVKKLTISKDGINLNPRNFASSGNKVYVSLYEGYLAEINAENFEVKTVKVGRSPEGLAYTDGKIYVANSGGADYPNYDNTVSIVDASSFTLTETLTVNTNPCAVKACGSNVYVYSIGDYGSVPSKLQLIKGSKVSDVSDYNSVAGIAANGNTLYVLTGEYDASWTLSGTVWKHDGAGNKSLGKVIEGISKAYSIAATSNYIWIGCSDYINNGDMVVVDAATGKQSNRFDVQGLNPITVAE